MRKCIDYMNPENYGCNYVTWVKIGNRYVINLDEVTYAKQDGSYVKVSFRSGSSTYLRDMTIDKFWDIVCKRYKAEKTDLPQ